MVVYMNSEPNLIDFNSTTMAVKARMIERFSPLMCLSYFLLKHSLKKRKGGGGGEGRGAGGLHGMNCLRKIDMDRH